MSPPSPPPLNFSSCPVPPQPQADREGGVRQWRKAQSRCPQGSPDQRGPCGRERGPAPHRRRSGHPTLWEEPAGHRGPRHRSVFPSQPTFLQGCGKISLAAEISPSDFSHLSNSARPGCVNERSADKGLHAIMPFFFLIIIFFYTVFHFSDWFDSSDAAPCSRGYHKLCLEMTWDSCWEKRASVWDWSFKNCTWLHAVSEVLTII